MARRKCAMCHGVDFELLDGEDMLFECMDCGNQFYLNGNTGETPELED